MILSKAEPNMSLRFDAIALVVFGISILLTLARGAEPAAKDTPKTPKSWTLPRTPDGQPDLQGYWTNGTYIPLERPKELASKEFFTAAEAAAYEKKKLEPSIARPPTTCTTTT